MIKSFTCRNCYQKVSLSAPGTHHRNHCPFCLYSLHLDRRPGDRSSVCGGLMESIGKFNKKDGEEVIVHHCLVCGLRRNNRVAGDDSIEAVRRLSLVEDNIA